MSLLMPIVDVVYPSDLAGVQNGKLDLTKLTRIGNTYCHPLAARAYFALKAAFEKAFPGTILGYTGMYRSYQGQVSIFDHETYPATGRYQHLFDAAVCISNTVYKVWHKLNGGDDRVWYQRNGTAMAAEPGTSNHGLALAIDFAIGANPATATGLTTAHVQWFIDHALDYGFSAESQKEDWHWRYVAGDHLPSAVLAYEASLHPAPPVIIAPAPVPVPEEDDMQPQLIRFIGYYNEILLTSAGPQHGSQELSGGWRQAYGVPTNPTWGLPDGYSTGGKCALPVDPNQGAPMKAFFKSTLAKLNLTEADLSRSDGH